MTIYSDEVTIYNADAVQQGINGANAQEQLIYKSAAAGTASMSGTTTWVDDVTGNQATWTLKRPQYNSSYPVLFVATQRKTVGGSVSCTTPQIDETTTIIDGGNIITGSVTANELDAGSIISSFIITAELDASQITTGELQASRINTDELRSALLEVAALLIGEQNNVHIETDGTGMHFMNGANTVASIDTASGTFSMVKSVVVEDIQFGDGRWKWYSRSNGNMALKWLGG